MRSILRKQKKILKVLKVIDKKRTKRYGKQINQMLKTINLSLRSSMKLPYFKKAYNKFIRFFLTKVRSFSQNHFKDPDTTARNFVRNNWAKFLSKAKKAWDQKQSKKWIEKRNKKKKYYN